MEEAKKSQKNEVKVGRTATTNTAAKVSVRITAKSLNVRDKSSADGKIVGKLAKDEIVQGQASIEGWYEIFFNGKKAYISAQYAAVVEKKGTITASSLNVRKEPDGEVVGKLTKGEKVVLLDLVNDWYKIDFKGNNAWVAAKFVQITPKSVARTFLFQNDELLKVALAPKDKKTVGATRPSRVVAETYNKFGNLLKSLSQAIGIEEATAIAVMGVESGGQGFIDNRLIIRFENHLFYRLWGKNNEKQYAEHFRYDADKQWLKHEFKLDKKDDWAEFHGTQDGEWKVFDFAYKIDKTAALNSISMGAPQILGSNSRVIGYDNVEDMYENFKQDIRYQIFAFFDFLNPKMVQYLQNSEFVNFAKYYNGTGQAQRYGKIIQDYYEAYKSL